MAIIVKTRTDQEIPDELFANYLSTLVNQFFKILPIREKEEPTLTEYMKSLQVEMIGAEKLIIRLNNDSQYLRLLNILQFMIDNDCDIPTTRSQVFKAISICNKLKEKHFKERE